MVNAARGSHEIMVAERASQLMGGGLAEEVQTFIYKARELRLCMHGIKRFGALSSVREDGVMPNTPEGGNVSFWATGVQIFHAGPRGNLSYFGFDTPFFDYSFVRNAGSSVMRGLAVTTLDALEATGIEYTPTEGSPDRQITIAERVPSALIDFYNTNSLDQVTSNRELFEQLYSAYA